MLSNPPRGERGIALITVVVVMLTMALIGASLAELSSAVNFSVDTILDETKARYLAEAGIAHALNKLRDGEDLSDTIDAEGNPVLFPLGEGAYSVTFEPEESLIICTGIVNETKKTLQLQYNVF
jgi:Tfp pilus assembly protein PilX